MRNAQNLTWVKTCTPETRARIRQVMDELDPLKRNHRDGWWIRLSPTTRTATEVTLLYKTLDGRTYEYPIMRKGKLI